MNREPCLKSMFDINRPKPELQQGREIFACLEQHQLRRAPAMRIERLELLRRLAVRAHDIKSREDAAIENCNSHDGDHKTSQDAALTADFGQYVTTLEERPHIRSPALVFFCFSFSALVLP